MKPFPLSISVVLVAVLLAACADTVTGPDDREPPRQLTAQEAELARTSGSFGLNLFRAVSQAAPGENVLISPLSVSMALGMTLNGADGETRAQMEAVLQQAGLSQAEINEAYRSLIALLTDLDPKVRLEIANSIWYREGYPVLPEFLETNQTYFDAEVQALDFNKPTAKDVINAWVEAKTNGNIETILDEPIAPDVIMYLINALYFQGDWRWQFDEDDTYTADFTREDGTTRSVQMMSMAEPAFATYYGDTFVAADLPYGDSLYSMTVLLPREGTSVQELVASLDADRWAAVTTGLQPGALARFEMPRFKLEYKILLNDALTALGMTDAFDENRADFSRINGTGGLYISRVLHKTFIEVDEEGTEAAAVTAVEIRETAAPPVLRLDRPFVFALRERHSGTLLFLGTLMDPGA